LLLALSNIAANAIDYTGENGNVTIRTAARNGDVIVAVQDTGIGIADEHLPHIFDRFYRADQARTTRKAGLGLSIARKIIEAHRGKIEVESVVGEGSVFRVVLPVKS
jgi:signal transduction histidine kinase